jgi:hypothetical protein
MRLRVLATLLVVGAVLATGASSARADEGSARECLRMLDALGVEYRTVKKRGIAIGVAVDGAIGGVEYRGYRERPLVLDCSLVVSLAIAGPWLREQGIERVTYSSAYDRRNIRGTNRPSSHSFGLAIDLHTLHRQSGEALRVADDYEQGLGHDADCVGAPLTEGGLVLKVVDCQLSRSGLFRIVLDPDYDAAHYNHFHIEALPWPKRADTAELWQRISR